MRELESWNGSLFAAWGPPPPRRSESAAAAALRGRHKPKPCSSCGAPMLWVQMQGSGSHHPMDVEPTSDGRFVVTFRKSEDRFLAEAFDPAQHARRNRYTSHFATCLHAAAHRRER